MKTVNDYEPFITARCHPTILSCSGLSPFKPLFPLFFTPPVFYVHITAHLALMHHSRFNFMALFPCRH